MDCPKCETGVAEGAEFCPECGETLRVAVDVAAAVNLGPDPRPRRGFLYAAWGLLGWGLVGLAWGVAVLILFGIVVVVVRGWWPKGLLSGGRLDSSVLLQVVAFILPVLLSAWFVFFKRPRRYAGLPIQGSVLRRLGGSGATLICLFVLAAGVKPWLNSMVGDVHEVGRAEQQMNCFQGAIELYYLRNRKMPTSLDVLTQEDSKTGEVWLRFIPLDPWGTPYQYTLLGGRRFKILSLGEDRHEGTGDDIRWPQAE